MRRDGLRGGREGWTTRRKLLGGGEGAYFGDRDGSFRGGCPDPDLVAVDGDGDRLSERGVDDPELRAGDGSHVQDSNATPYKCQAALALRFTKEGGFGKAHFAREGGCAQRHGYPTTLARLGLLMPQRA